MNLATFLHVLAAMVLVGSLVLALTSLASDNLRLAFRALVMGVIPSWIAMRVAAQWAFSEAGFGDVESLPAWIDLGFVLSESSFVLLVAAAVCARIASRRERGGGLATAAMVLVGITLLAYVVAIWAMTAKPS